MNLRNLVLLGAAWLLPVASPTVVTTRFGDYLDDCPVACTDNAVNWSKYHGHDALFRCKDPVLFDFNILLENVDSTTVIRACSLASNATAPSPLNEPVASDFNSTIASLTTEEGCGASKKRANLNVTVGTASAGRSQSIVAVNAEQAKRASINLANFLTAHASCGSTSIFSKVEETIVGFYLGADIAKSSALPILQHFQSLLDDHTVYQSCQDNKNGPDTTVGAIVGAVRDFDSVLHGTVKSWVSGTCARSPIVSSAPLAIDVLTSPGKNTTSGGGMESPGKQLSTRGECRDIQVAGGDSCSSLASRCGISGPDFEKYNAYKKNLCSTLQAKQYVCCSSGTLPDHRPKPGSNGSCYSYKVGKGAGCWDIADKFGLTQQDIEAFNKKTWGWAGCSHLQADQLICLSAGTPPFPLPVQGTKCGPLVPGSKPSPGQSDFSTLNPCPLNACCDIWGFCGITADFCKATPADTGAPGTAQPGTNGCISNCGTDIKQSSPPSEFRKLAYFEAWNWQRPCLHMNVDSINGDYNYVHFAFATVSKDWKVVIDGKIKSQFDQFKKINGKWKVLSFGGWAFSTDPDTFQRFRDATKDANRETFSSNVVKFLEDNNLDGLDFDWEYPGAPDIPDVPPGGADEGKNYLKFLAAVRSKLKANRSLSIAIPSSFWYLQAYPINAMKEYVDYFVYMTYDLHGQWDYGNKWTSPGCSSGNCIRSHINMTETRTALSMITKAGIPSNQVVVGVSSYGRSFRLKDAGCTTPECLFTGSSTSSDAYKGRCTDTSGYISNAELQEIKNGKKYSTVKSWYDAASDSNMMLYGQSGKLDWVAYMDNDTKKKRTNLYKGLNFGGITDWAVDLADFQKDDGGRNPDGPKDPSTLTCKDAKLTWKPMDITPIQPSPYGTGKPTYVAIVNLTPYKFKVTSTHAYQYKIDFQDVYPGHMMQGYFTRGNGNSPVDDKAEIYYELEGTDKKFAILLRNNNKGGTFERVICDLRNIGASARELMVPGQAPVVITGSKRAGFRASLYPDARVAGWMKSIKHVIKDRTISQLVMPGTHDSAMSKISHSIDSPASASNTQTQHQNIYDQLRLGARWFDMRVISVHNTTDTDKYSFYGAHLVSDTAEVALGNTGESLDSMIDDINRFTSENPGEVIFVRLRYMVGIRKTPSQGFLYWWYTSSKHRIFDAFIEKLRGVENRCPGLIADDASKKDTLNTTIGTLMDQNDGKGCVILLLSPDKFQGTQEDLEQKDLGMYDAIRVPFNDNWAETDKFSSMVSQETGAFFNPSDGAANVLITQWFVTLEGIEVTSGSIFDNAMGTNPLMYSHAFNEMTPTKSPGVLMIDYIGETELAGSDFQYLGAELATLAIGLNQYMLAENCDMDGNGYPPLLDYPDGYADFASPAGFVPDEPAWNGFMFANGTVIDDPPEDLGELFGPENDDDGETLEYI